MVGKPLKLKFICSTLMTGALLLSVPFTTYAASLPWEAPAAQPESPVTVKQAVTLMNEASELAGSKVRFSLDAANPVTRENLAVMLGKSLGLPDVKEPFTDVPDHNAAAGAIGALYEKQIMKGISDTLFAPAANVTQQQTALIAERVYEYLKPFELNEATIADIQQAVSQGKLTYKELTQMYLDRISKYDDQGVKLSAVISLNPKALEEAEKKDQERKENGVRGPLHGIPILVKDNYATADMPTTAGCLCLKDSVPSQDAEMIRKLKEAGAIILGKTNLDEFASGIDGASSLGGQTLNPYALDHSPGGSSAGTGAAIASNFALGGFGTDTGGSIRIPSSYNSLVGIRPTVGLTSRDGIIPLALTQDTGGPMSRTVTDAAILLDATAGYDPEDVATAYGIGHRPASYTTYLDKDGLKGARIGVATELFGTDSGAQPVTDLVNAAVKDLSKLGATTVPIAIPNLDEIMAYPSLSNYEFKFQLNDYLAKYEPDAPYHSLTEIINSGQFYKPLESSLKARDARDLGSEEYKDIVLKRTKLTRDALLKVMADHNLDAIVYPSTVQASLPIGESSKAGNNNRLSPFSGFPAISVPAGFTPDGLAAGIEFLGRSYDEPTLIKFAYAYEQGTHHRKPPALLP
ncbi:amidase [Paenibacillus sp. CAA11]|uniref:amidase family protein n=1 Tax=Paenibacillus sp. CAA11 TaxID=1532905 RepID=UPI000D3DA4E2|nr:amidase family protein [Paenibacillus sp. CAA11]AWB46494.1 amidase [Paenibacillus sp. CAA11]